MGAIDLPANHGTAYLEKPVTGKVRNLPAYTVEEQLAWILHEEVSNLVHHIASLSPGQDGLKEQLYDSLQQNILDTLKRCPPDHGESDPSVRYSPKAVTDLLYTSGGGKFNTGEIEKSAVNTAASNNLEAHTNSILRHTAGGDNTCTVVKCAFMDNGRKPATVTDVKLAVNVLDSALISPGFYDCAVVKYFVKDLICRQIIEGIKDISPEAPGDQTSQASQNSDQSLLERITGICSAIDPSASNIREHIRKLAAIEDIRDLGFDIATRSLASILDSAKMPYQFIDYRKNERELVIREYEDDHASSDGHGPSDTKSENLPDERYMIRLRYLDNARLAQERIVYDDEIKRFEHDVQQLWKLVEVLYQDSKSIFKVHDYEDLVKKNKSRISAKTAQTGVPYGGEFSPQGQERAALARMHERIKNTFNSVNPKERKVVEERLAWLETERTRLEQMINPHQLRTGLLIDIELTSIKRKKTTLDSMAAVLNGFLATAPGDFQEAALAVFGSPPQEAHTKAHKK